VPLARCLRRWRERDPSDLPAERRGRLMKRPPDYAATGGRIRRIEAECSVRNGWNPFCSKIRSRLVTWRSVRQAACVYSLIRPPRMGSSDLVCVVRAKNLIHNSDQQSCPPGRLAVMIIGHVPVSYQLHANAYITKPVDSLDLFTEAIRQVNDFSSLL
jgi:hypothetical protein